jgi:hypothetical protein
LNSKQNNIHITQKMINSTPLTDIEQISDPRAQKSRVYAIGANIGHGQRLFCISPIKEYLPMEEARAQEIMKQLRCLV